jgi:hypothetical protein
MSDVLKDTSPEELLSMACLLEENGGALLRIAGHRSQITGEPFPDNHPSLILGNAQMAGAAALRSHVELGIKRALDVLVTRAEERENQ